MHECRPLSVKVWSEYALFTQPEMKVERVSYPVMTPSAARGILEAIFWKPEFEWRVQEIHVFKPIQFFSVLRNEVAKVASESIKGKLDSDFCADDPDNRTQRHSLVLRDVAYAIVADIRLRTHATDDVAKYRDMFRRRVQRGQCFQRPYMGCREFAAFFSPVSAQDKPIPLNYEVGNMLFDIRYAGGAKGTNIPIFFRPEVSGGVLRVPQHMYEQRGR